MLTAFIGSSRESQEVAEQVAVALSEKGFSPIRWWDAIETGEITIDRLRDLAEDVDAAVIVWSDDDKIWHRGSEQWSARDNCILEYGLFLSRLGRLRTGLFLKQGVKLPSDLLGLTVKTYASDIRGAAISLSAALKKNMAPTFRPIVPIIPDPDVQQKLMGPNPQPIPAAWASRSLYCRDEGAANWLRIVNDPEYPLSPIRDTIGIKRLLIDSLKCLNATLVNTVVSLGPGDARAEREVLQELRSKDSPLEWVPVDISHGLLNCAISMLKKDVPIRCGVLGDFEEGLAFIRDQLEEAKSPALVTLLGGTFGNMDNGDSAFLNNLKARLRKGDFLLIDAPIKGTEWVIDLDSRWQTDKYADSFIKLLCNGLSCRLGVSTHILVNEFHDRVECLHETSEAASIVPNCDAIRIIDKESRLTMLRFCRYDWSKLKEWISDEVQGFKILYEAKTTPQCPDILGMGVLLLQKE